MQTLNPLDGEIAAYRGQSFAVDLVKIDGFGSRARGPRPRNPLAYHIFGDPLHAPCDGAVLHAEDGHPDLERPETGREHMAGNHALWLVARLLCSWRIFNETALQWLLVRVSEREIASAQSGTPETRPNRIFTSMHSERVRPMPLVKRAAADPTRRTFSRSQ